MNAVAFEIIVIFLLLVANGVFAMAEIAVEIMVLACKTTDLGK
jgi:hypothetical protein